MHDGSNQSIKDRSNTLGKILSLKFGLTKLHNMNKEKYITLLILPTRP